ncbi:MAG: hypothetical protein WCY09_04440 [Candidatus Omnitrophota bacterium]
MQKIKKKNNKIQFSNSLKDLFAGSIVLIIVSILSYFFDVFIFIVRYLEKHPHKIVYVDEVIVGFLTLSIVFAVFSWRRWLELKKETAERIKLQEELIALADTKAEIERIICKQLRSEIELRK